jgi:hypothetical protein
MPPRQRGVQKQKKSSRTVSRTWSPGRPQKKKGTNAERTLEDGGAPDTTGAQRAARVWNNIPYPGYGIALAYTCANLHPRCRILFYTLTPKLAYPTDRPT